MGSRSVSGKDSIGPVNSKIWSSSAQPQKKGARGTGSRILARRSSRARRPLASTKERAIPIARKKLLNPWTGPSQRPRTAASFGSPSPIPRGERQRISCRKPPKRTAPARPGSRDCPLRTRRTRNRIPSGQNRPSYNWSSSISSQDRSSSSDKESQRTPNTGSVPGNQAARRNRQPVSASHQKRETGSFSPQ